MRSFLVCATDGAASDQAHPLLRRAGWAAFFGDRPAWEDPEDPKWHGASEHSQNAWGAMAGSDQAAPGAEVAALEH
eukprot:13374500-Alexandrium_andersonii.AAC.1